MRLKMKSMVITSMLLLSFEALAGETKLERLKTLFSQAGNPHSAEVVKARMPQLTDCAEFTPGAPNVPSGRKLVMVRYTSTPVGPEFPANSFEGIGFTGADAREALFFDGYVETPTASGLRIAYSYQYSHHVCWGSGADRECEWEDVQIAGDGLIRLTDRYIVFARGDSYGYCW